MDKEEQHEEFQRQYPEIVKTLEFWGISYARYSEALRQLYAYPSTYVSDKTFPIVENPFMSPDTMQMGTITITNIRTEGETNGHGTTTDHSTRV